MDVLAFNVFGTNHLPNASGGIIYDSTTGLELGCITVTGDTNPRRASVMLTGLVNDRPGIQATFNVAIWNTGTAPGTVYNSNIGRNQLTYTIASSESVPRVTDVSQMAVEPWDDGVHLNWRIVVANPSTTDTLVAHQVTITQDPTHVFACSAMPAGTVLIKYTQSPIDGMPVDVASFGTVESCSETQVVVNVGAVAPFSYTTFQLFSDATEPHTDPHTVTATNSSGASIVGVFDHFPDDRDGTAQQPNAIVLAEAPAVNPTVCVEGETVLGEGVVFSASENATVTIGDYDPTATAPQNVEVQVTTHAGYYFDENDPAFNGDVWTVTPNEDGTETATTSVTVTNIPCTPVVPAPATITATMCVDNSTVAGSVQLPSTAGITYSHNFDPAASGAQQVTITATLQPGYSWGVLDGSGYTATSSTVASYTSPVSNVPCVPVIPAAATIVATTCVDNTTQAGSVTFATTAGVTYSHNYDPASTGEQTVTVTATLESGYSWGNLDGTGFTASSASVATFTAVVTNSPCAVSPSPSPSPTTPAGTPAPGTPDPTGTPTAPVTPAPTSTAGTDAGAPEVTGLPETGSGQTASSSMILMVMGVGLLISAVAIRRRFRQVELRQGSGGEALSI